MEKKTNGLTFEDFSPRGAFTKGILYMNLSFPIKENLSEYNIHDLGTLIHEYIHYLQNISTPWGMYESMAIYSDILTIFAQINKDDEVIKVPLAVNRSPYSESRMKHISLNYGRRSSMDGIDYHLLSFSKLPKIHIHVNYYDDKIDKPYVVIDFESKQVGMQSITLGAWILKESMASMIQRKFDPNPQSEVHDIPYRTIEIICENYFPNIASDINKMIVLCYAALFTMTPGYSFIDMAKWANTQKDKTAKELFWDLFHDRKVIVNGKEKLSFADFYRDISARFLDIMQKLCHSIELKYIPAIISNTQFQDEQFPILWFLEQDVDAQKINEFMDKAGFPAMLGTDDTSLFPHLADDINSQFEIVLLIGYETLYRFLTEAQCPRLPMCIPQYLYEDSCHETPWQRYRDCPLKAIAEIEKLNNMEIQY